ncbi:copper amine oxidase N-terminal domain-containing protein [Paenibacillus puerhi]|uniref:copper amine oxidase N-terminal domain-containing protein n=1 Tax=Paenibacillus puerhi TaxID=2692622 RepID=UPI00135C546D|nr:copper amine oxidase N-terminal domain-containing protein [Paenibacillus puerhi]
MKSLFTRMLVLLMLSVLLVPSGMAQASETTSKWYWGETKTGVYQPLHPNTLNWSGNVLDKGGLNLTTLKQTAKPDEADMVINQYGAIGASAILKLEGEKLEDPTPRDLKGFSNSYTLAVGDIYLVMLSTGQYAKVKIDQASPANGASYQQVSFSYVLESKEKAAAEPEPKSEPKLEPKPDATVNKTSTDAAGRNKPASTIKLTIGNPYAVVQGNTETLQVPPVVVNGTTLVPLRFLAESLGAEVKWDGTERKITLIQEKQTITLWIDKLSATVNGGTTALEAAPQIIEDTTVVPIRFISEAFSQLVDYDPDTRSITITGELGAAVSPSPAKPADAAQEIEKFAVKDYDFDTFAGSYDLWIEGGATNLYDKDTGNYATHEYTAGAAAGTLTINTDGTYTIKTTETKSGTWRPSKVNEVFGYEDSIILENGPDNINWTLLVNANGKTMLSYEAGKWTDGSVMWLPYYIASKR